ncbi:MAG: Flp family type IVb pilin [Pseudomonadota bacterium]
MRRWLSALRANEGGATAIEYGLIMALVALAIVVSLTALGVELNALFDAPVTTLQAALNN